MFFWLKLFFKRDKNRENAGALSQWSLKNYYVTFQGYINISMSIIMCSNYYINMLELFLLEMLS